VDDEKGRYGYTTKRFYDEETCVIWGGDRNASLSSSHTWIIEVSGSGCRAFERRFVDRYLEMHSEGVPESELDKATALQWALVIDTALLFGGHVTRIDVAVDDFSGRVPYSGVIKKIESRSYLSSLRSRGRDGTLEDPLVEKQGIGESVSYYIGSKSCVMLNVYNKKAERESKACVVDIPSWTRWELRYHDRYAVACAPEVSAALKENRFPAFAAGLLGGIVSFRSLSSNPDRAHLSRYPVWRPWERFLKGVSSHKIICQVRAESTVSSNAKWLNRDAGKALSRFAFASPENAEASFIYLLNSGFSRFGSKDLIVVNNYRKEKGLPVYSSKEECLKNASGWFDVFRDIPAEVESLFGKQALKLGSAKYDSESFKGRKEGN
jgi:DNA relaxase NicK